ncbi:hypothetical protein EI94DRAFT_1211616 [Lactarius quietus]|nr:hypothetical protein EI94DRAFT_1211616 [Lactarius quietus]
MGPPEFKKSPCMLCALCSVTDTSRSISVRACNQQRYFLGPLARVLWKLSLSTSPGLPIDQYCKVPGSLCGTRNGQTASHATRSTFPYNEHNVEDPLIPRSLSGLNTIEEVPDEGQLPLLNLSRVSGGGRVVACLPGFGIVSYYRLSSKDMCKEVVVKLGAKWR